jgi:penicillin-binding protein 1C
MPRLAPHLADRVAAGGQGRHVLTLDADLQRRLEALVARHARGLDERISVAALVVDHDTGAVRAAVGARAYGSASGQGFVDMTRALRSPGSTLKPLVYGLAFDAGLAHPETLILDAPVMFGRYAPQNFDGRFRGEVTVREALQESLNVPVVSLTEALGPARVMAALRRAGVAAELPGGTPGLAISLGGLGVTLADMVALYAALARGGEAVPLRWHADASTEHRARVLSRSAAWHLGQVLSQVPPPGAYGLAGKVAFKTGTSYGHRDAWALGWDGTHTAGVWLGRPDGTPVPGAFGGEMAAPLLIEALALARQGPAALAPPPPEALLLANAELPGPLRRFGGRNERASLSVMFPPEGARLERGLEIPVRLRGGVPPFTLLVDGAVVATGLRRTEFTAPAPRAGFTTLSVIDAHGRSGRVTVELR